MNEKERPAPRIYVADLAAYNAAELRGEWIELTPDTTVEDLQQAIRALLERCSRGEYVAEEYAIHDYENFHGYELDEYEHPETVVKVAAFIAEHGELGAKLVNQSYDVDEARGVLEDQYAGCGDSLADWASEFLEDSGQLAEIPERWRTYIDFEQYANDLELGGDVFAIEAEGKVHVFWTR
ncbi:MAG: antirestriction protein ArdA [Deltaproteobacteria bacterium]|nr:antirestriction protein ArdA [Deltaproteobacteria bacterium]